jgi:DNA ligase (NAD+)
MIELIKKLNKSNDIISLISELTIKELEDIIEHAADKYYNTSKSVISDAIYDMLIDFLKLKNPKSNILKNIGAKVKGKNKVTLDYWLGSMDKIKPPSNQLDHFILKYNAPYYLSDKLDGISALIVYRNNNINMFTRGTSTEGLDISHLVKYLKNIPSFDIVEKYCKNKLKTSNKNNIIALRGELIIKNAIFTKNWSDKFKNARNTVSGLVNSKKINPELAQDVELVVYEVIDPFDSMDKQLKIIKDLNFNSVHYKVVNNLSYELLSEHFKNRRSNSDFQIDGIIVTNENEHKRNIQGNPDYAFAFKDILEDQKAKTTITDIEWNISKDGYLIPTLLLKPVIISGVEIKRVTGHNARNVIDNKLGVGCDVEIIRSGDVIPKINKVLKPGKVKLPEGNWSWNESKVDIILDQVDKSEDVVKKNIYFFFSTLDTKGLGEKNVEKLVNAGYDTIPLILSLDHDTLLNLEKEGKLEGFKEKTITNLLKAITKAVSNVSLSQIMAASNKLGHGLGHERMKQILANYPNILEDHNKWTKKEFIANIKEINGWDTKTATLFVSNFNNFVNFYNSIKKYIKLKKDIIVSGKLSDKIFVFSSFRDKELESLIENLGGKINTTPSKNTNYLVIKNDAVTKTSKILKAEELGITIITKDKLNKMLLQM